MPVDKFGRMSDLKTKDTGVSLTYINNNYVRSDGETPLTGSLDMRGNTLYNVADPVNPQDVVTKVYVDNTKGSGVIGRKIGDSVSIKENMDFLGKQKIKNLPDPVNDHDAVTKKYVDEKDAVTKEYVDDKTKNLFIDENDNIAFGLNVDMEGNKIFSLPKPEQDHEPATKKYVDDLQNQYIDKRGNIKFGRNINLDNKRIFALKDPKKDYEATNKKYVDDTITKRLQEEKDNFLPQDPATKEYVDEAVKQLAGGDLLVSKEGVFIKANGHYRATASLDIDNHKMENLPDPVDDKDAVNKKYIDGIIENLTLKQGLIRENGGFNLVDSYINMNFHNIRNVGLPKDESDAVPRRFVDSMIKEVDEKIGKLPHIIAVNTRYCGVLKNGEYPFKFANNNFGICEEKIERYEDFKGLISGFVMPQSGRIKKIICESLTYVKYDEIVDAVVEYAVKQPGLSIDPNVPHHWPEWNLRFSIREKLDKFISEDKLKIGVKPNEEFFFKIVRFEKRLNLEDYPIDKNQPKIISSVLVEKFNLVDLGFGIKSTGIGAIIKILNHDYKTLLEGDVINIEVVYKIKLGLPGGGNFETYFDDVIYNALKDKLNFNFTFLIELDPL